ncbi:MAG: DUF3794 domain-containing protein [Clostridia bacterium]|nr:DUF3794 domain-containing protein [Clostridia bacterium]
MELQTTMRRIGLTGTIFDDFDERPVDCDFMLPDFLPDIAAVLKCTMKPVVQSHQISGDRVMADGTVYLNVLYLDEGRKCVRSFENSQPFTSVFTVKDLSAGDRVALSAKTNYVNCRATSPRRVDVHGAFSVKLLVTSRVDAEVVQSAEARDLYTKECKITCTADGGSAEKPFTINEVLELESDVPAETIVRNEAHICISDCKQLSGKAVIKGDLLLKTVYATDTVAGTLCQAKHCIPFSQILDVEGLNEETLCECHAEIVSCDVRLSQNPNGESRLLSVSVKSILSLRCFVQEVCDLLTDAFHTVYPLTLTTQRIMPSCITNLSRETVTVQQSLPLPDGAIVEIVDAWSEVVTVSCQDGMLGGQLLVQLIGRDANGMVSYYERPLDVSVPIADACDQTTVSADVLDTEYTLAGDGLELRIRLLVCRRTSICESHLVVTALQADESAPHPCAQGMENCQVKVCFAKAGDSLWEIAKAEHASPTALMKENNLSEEILRDRTMLLIPLC